MPLGEESDGQDAKRTDDSRRLWCGRSQCLRREHVVCDKAMMSTVTGDPIMVGEGQTPAGAWRGQGRVPGAVHAARQPARDSARDAGASEGTLLVYFLNALLRACYSTASPELRWRYSAAPFHPNPAWPSFRRTARPDPRRWAHKDNMEKHGKSPRYLVELVL